MAADDGGQVAIRFSSLDNHHFADLKITMIEGSLSGDRHDRRIWSQQVFPLVAARLPGLVKLVLRATHDRQPAEAFAYVERAVYRIAFEADRYVLAIKDTYAGFGKREGRHLVTEVSATGSRSGADVLGPAFEDDPAGWLRYKAPQEWTRDHRAETREKQQWLKSASAATRIRASCPAEHVRSAWNTVVDRDIAVSRQPANKNEFDVFKGVTGFALPRELKTLASLSNGADLSPHRYGGLLTVEEIAECWISWKSIYDDWRLEELTENRVNDDPRVIEAYVIPAWIPFIDENGSMIGFDRQPGPGGEIGQIVSYGRDVESSRVVAANLAAFLESL